MGGTRLFCTRFLGLRGLSDVDCRNALGRKEMMLKWMRFCERIFFCVGERMEERKGSRGKWEKNEKRERRCMCEIGKEVLLRAEECRRERTFQVVW